MPLSATKGRPPISSYQDVLLEPIQGATTIVIHPGSFYLRIGRASDAFPQTIPHVIGRRRKGSHVEPYEDPLLIPQLNVYQNRELSTVMEKSLTSVIDILESRPTTDGRGRYATPPSTIFEMNSNCKPDSSDSSTDLHWAKIESSQSLIIGEEVLYLNPKSDFNIHWPIRRGLLNIHPGVGGSETAVLSDLEDIWGAAIQNYLEIPLKDLKHYRAVLVIPDVYSRRHVKEMVNLLLIRLGFGACTVHHEAVCSTFGAGLSYACVVDVGDQKTSVVCVEDGISQRQTRLTMEYGGADITQVFFWLLKKCGFPYKRCDSSSRVDALLLHELKETMCHVNMNVCGPQIRFFQVKRPGNPTLSYKLHTGDECMVAPLSLFYQDLLGLTGSKKVRTQQRSTGDPEDPHDQHYLRETSQRRGPKENTESGSANLEISTHDDVQMAGNPLEDDIDPSDNPSTHVNKESEKEVHCDQLLSIDQAILQSIERCSTDETKRKMYSCILVVGGGLMFDGLNTWLYNNLYNQIPLSFRMEPMEIITRAKDMDPRITTWKGAAVTSCLDTTQELWIRPSEWVKTGVKLLRERVPFIW
ncbi:actin-like protein arp8 [Chamberlinius hualienensis]